MLEFTEVKKVPDMASVRVMEGYENVCEACENWGEACETCDVSVPLVVDRWKEKEITYRQMSICGVPAGEPYAAEETIK